MKGTRKTEKGIGALASDLSLPHEEAERLLRVGYIKVDRTGLFGGNLFVAADEIDRVEGETIYLAINGDDRTN